MEDSIEPISLMMKEAGEEEEERTRMRRRISFLFLEDMSHSDFQGNVINFGHHKTKDKSLNDKSHY